MEALAEEVLAYHGGVHILVNNAGVTVVSTFESQAIEDIEWLMGVNFWGVIYGCKVFLPALRRADEAHIVNLSSVFGIVGVPLQSSYCASKFAVRGFTESLRAELADTSIGVTCVHPAGVATNIARDGRYRGKEVGAKMREGMVSFITRMLPPETVADRIVLAVRQNQSRVLVAGSARVIDTVQRVSPALGGRIVLGIWKRMQAQ